MGNPLGKIVARVRRGKRLLGTTKFIVLSNFLRTGIVDFLRQRPPHSAALDEIVDFYFKTAAPPHPEDIELLLDYCRANENPTKIGYVRHLIQRAKWLEPRRADVKFREPSAERYDWNPLIRALHAEFDANFEGKNPQKRKMARAHWHNFLQMADAFGIVSYENERASLSPRALKKLTREMEIFADGYWGVDDLLGVLLKVEALRGETEFIVTPPPFMLETCDALARRIGIAAYLKFSPRLREGGCRILDLGCGSGIYSNALAERGNKCVAVDTTPWVFYRAFLGARDGVRVENCDMNALPERLTREPFSHAISNIAAHHLRNRVQFFQNLRNILGENGEICVFNFDYSVPSHGKSGPISRMKRQFAAQIQYNWTVLDYAEGRVQFISPRDVARDLEWAGFSAEAHACDPLGELFFVRGVKK
jgi:SAM-dependent methyltransferase